MNKTQSHQILSIGKYLLVLWISLSFMMMGTIPLRAQEMTADQIMDKSFNQPRPNDSHFEMLMLSANKQGRERKRSVRGYSKTYKNKDGVEFTKTLMQFLEPPDERGTGFLSWENPSADDDQWLFLPAMNKTRRIAAGNKSESFMGTDFTYSDLQSKELSEYTYRKLGEEKAGPYDCYVIETVPKPETKSDYSKTEVWVDKNSFVVVQAKYYDKKDKLLKILRVLSLENKDGFWTPLETKMENVQKESKTLLKLINVKYNGNLGDEYFEQSYMERGV